MNKRGRAMFAPNSNSTMTTLSEKAWIRYMLGPTQSPPPCDSARFRHENGYSNFDEKIDNLFDPDWIYLVGRSNPMSFIWLRDYMRFSNVLKTKKKTKLAH